MHLIVSHNACIHLSSIRNKFGQTILDLLPIDDIVVRPLVRKAQQEASLAREEVVDGIYWLFVL
jgi:hypothetical protein